MKAEEDVTQRGRYDWWWRAIVMGRSCLMRHIVYKNGTFYGRLHRNGKGAESLYMHTLYELRKAALALECMNVLWHYQRMTANETDVCSVSVFFFFFIITNPLMEIKLGLETFETSELFFSLNSVIFPHDWQFEKSNNNQSTYLNKSKCKERKKQTKT